MPGHMGNEYVTVNSLRVMKIDKSLNLLYVKGSIPGPRESIVCVRDAIFEAQNQFDAYVNPPPFPTISTEQVNQIPVELEWIPEKDAQDPLAKMFNVE
jgi:hypothetical protein